MEKTKDPAGPNGQTKTDNPAQEPALTDEELRRLAAERLAEHLDVGSTLILRCETLSLTTKGDKLGPINAAARLMRANAHVAEVLANVAQVERRRRSIVERIQPPDRKKVELNSHLQNQKTSAETMLKFWNRVDEHIDQSVRARLGEEGAHDSVARIIKSQEELLESTNRQLDELGEE
jgi:hypothetical protein